MWLAVMTAVAKLLCQNPETFNSKPKNKKKLEKNSKTNSQNVHLDMIIEVLTTPTKISSFLKRPSKTRSKFEKIPSLKFSWQIFFPSIQFFGQIECSLATLLINFCQTTEKFMCSKSEKACEFPKKYFSLLFSFEHVIWFFDNTGEYLLPKT